MSKKSRKTYTQTSFLPKTLVSVIIAVHRRFDILAKCLEALPAAFDDIEYEVIIIDNNSPNDEKLLIYPELKKLPRYRIYEWNENRGFPKACNFGAKNASSPLIFFLNSDVIMSPHSGVKTVALLDDPKVGIAGMKLLFPETVEDVKLNQAIRPAGKVQHIGVAVNMRGELHHVLSGWSADNPKVLKIRDVHMVTGATLMTRKPLFTKVGGFFEGYGMGTFEDCDYSLTVRKLGYNIVVDSSTYAIHYTGATSEGYQIPYPINQNKFLFMQRWMNQISFSDWIYW
jgi:GT2 family glycosyltransferase